MTDCDDDVVISLFGTALRFSDREEGEHLRKISVSPTIDCKNEAVTEKSGFSIFVSTYKYLRWVGNTEKLIRGEDVMQYFQFESCVKLYDEVSSYFLA